MATIEVAILHLTAVLGIFLYAMLVFGFRHRSPASALYCRNAWMSAIAVHTVLLGLALLRMNEGSPQAFYLLWGSWLLAAVYLLVLRSVDHGLLRRAVATAILALFSLASFYMHFPLHGVGSARFWVWPAHILPSVLAFVFALCALALSAAYLLVECRIKGKRSRFTEPSLHVLDRAAFRFVVAAFVAVTVAISSGAAVGALRRPGLAVSDLVQWLAVMYWLLFGFLILGRRWLLSAPRRRALVTAWVSLIVVVSLLAVIVLRDGTLHGSFFVAHTL